MATAICERFFVPLFVLCSCLPRAVICWRQTGGSEWSFSWRTGPWASDPYSGNSLLLAFSMAQCHVTSSPWRVRCNWRGIRAPLGSFLSLGPRTSLFLCSSSAFPHPPPQGIWPLLDTSLHKLLFQPQEDCQTAQPRSLVTWVAPLETEPGVGRVRLWRSVWTWANHPLVPLHVYAVSLRQLWGRKEVARGQHMGRGTSLLALPLSLWLKWWCDLIIWAFGNSFQFPFPSFKPLPDSLSSCQ